MKRTPTSSLLLLCLAAPLAAQGTEDLKIPAKKGASVWLKQESKQESNIDFGGQTMEQSMTTSYVLQVTVKDVDDKGQLIVETKCVRVFGTATLPMMGEIEFDSLDQKADGKDDGDDGMGMGMPNPDAIGKGLTSLAGQTFVAKLDAYGNVTSMDGIDKMLETARNKAGKMGAQMLGAQLNEKNLERLVESAFGTRPSKAIKVGESWDQAEEQKSSRMDVNNKMKLTLTKADAECFEITADGTVEKAAAEPKKDADGKKDPKKDEGEDDDAHAMIKEAMANLKISNGKIKGTQKLSRTDGFVVTADSTMSMVLTMPSPMGGGEMTIDQKMITTTKRTTEADGMKKGGAAKAKDEPKPALKDSEPTKGK